MTQKYYFFIGTEAELIKMTPTLKLFQDREISYKIISSGQNVIGNSKMLEYLHKKVDIYLTKKPVYQTPFGLVLWLFSTLFKGFFILTNEFKNKNKKNIIFIVHGDTVSTLLGAVLGRLIGLKIAHVEAGYKSPNLFRPFPEELDRTFASMLSDVLFCPFDSIGSQNRSMIEKSINIGLNTSIDSLHLALKTPIQSSILSQLKGKKFFIFALHRQETLINKRLFIDLIHLLMNLKTDLYCVFALHHPTKKLLEDLGLLDILKQHKNIIITPRLQYFEYIHMLDASEFIMTDGVGNQQETYYLGKPCLILRKVTEGLEGLGKNALLSNNDLTIIDGFVANYKSYKKTQVKYSDSPSEIIAHYLLQDNKLKMS